MIRDQKDKFIQLSCVSYSCGSIVLRCKTEIKIILLIIDVGTCSCAVCQCRITIWQDPKNKSYSIIYIYIMYTNLSATIEQ